MLAPGRFVVGARRLLCISKRASKNVYRPLRIVRAFFVRVSAASLIFFCICPASSARASTHSSLTEREEDVLILPGVRVLGERPGLRAAASSDWDVLSGDALLASGARSLDEALASGVAGVRVERQGGREQGGSVRIRGMGGARVLILIDGAALGSGAGADLPDIPITEIERIEILRGAASARYGDRAMGGVINIVTKKDERNDIVLDLGYGSFMTRNAAVSLPFTFGRTRFGVAASAEKSDGGWLFPGQVHESPGGETTLDGDKVRARSTGYTVYRGRAYFSTANLHGTRLDLDGEYSAREAGVPGTIDFPIERADMRDQFFKFSAGVSALPSLAPGDRLEFSGAYSRRERRYRDYSLFNPESRNALQHGMALLQYSIPISIFSRADGHDSTGGQRGASGQDSAAGADAAGGGYGIAGIHGAVSGGGRARTSGQDSATGGSGAGADAAGASGNNGGAAGTASGDGAANTGKGAGRNFALLRFGLQAEHFAFDGGSAAVTFGAPSRSVFAFFTDGEVGAGDFTFSLALRGDYHEGFGAFLSPGLGAAWSFHEDWRAAINVNSAYRVPSFEELFWPGGAFAVGNADLRTENAVSGDCSLSWKPGAGAEARLTAFVQTYDDLILWQPSAGGVWRPVNIANVLSRGAEATLRGEFPLSGAWFLAYAFEYSYQICEDASLRYNGRQVPRVPREKGSARLSLGGPGGFAFHLNGSYTGFRYLNRANTKYLGEYFLLDSALTLGLASGVNIKFVVRNIFDTAYVHLREYPVPGREWTVSLEVRL